METLIKECERCKEDFKADRRQGVKNARVCGKAVCLKWRATEGKRQWRQDNPDYDSGSGDRHRPGYWKDYRRRHPDKAERNRIQTRERIGRRRRLFATQDSIRRDPVGYLTGLGGGAMFATQDSTVRRVDGIIVYLRTFATQDSMDGRVKTAV